jgi:hypothetical protein
MSEPCASVTWSMKSLTLLPTGWGAWVSLTVGLDVSAKKLIHSPSREPNPDRPSRNPVTNLGWANLPETLRVGWRGSWDRGSLSVGLCEGILGEGLPLWGPWRIFKKGSWDGHLFIGAPLLGNLEEGSSSRDFERGSGDGVSLSQEAPWGDLGEGSFTREPERWGFWEICKCPVGEPLLGAVLRNLEGIRLLGHLREIKSTSEYLCEPGGHSGFKSEWGFNLTQANLSGFLPFGLRG